MRITMVRQTEYTLTESLILVQIYLFKDSVYILGSFLRKKNFEKSVSFKFSYYTWHIQKNIIFSLDLKY